ncbi:hypothetical protein GCM10025734_03950 [Kitasatospora paranensis]
MADGTEQGDALILAQATPDAVGLTDGQRVFEALRADGAPGTDPFGGGFPIVVGLAAFARRVEEQLVVRGAARGP